MQIIATIEALYSKRDRNGNTYWALRYTDHETGRTAVGTVSGGESNIRQLMYVDGWHSERYMFIVTPCGIREFNQITKGWPYAGCTRDELVAEVRRQLTA